MMARRRVLQASALGGVVGLLAATPDSVEAAPAAAAQGSDRATLTAATAAIEGFRADLRAERAFADIEPIRAAQKTFLRTNGKLPDFIEVGVDLWFAVHDWHVRWQQPLVLGVDVSGRRTIALMQTLVVLRPEAQPSFMSQPYDSR